MCGVRSAPYTIAIYVNTGYINELYNNLWVPNVSLFVTVKMIYTNLESFLTTEVI